MCGITPPHFIDKPHVIDETGEVNMLRAILVRRLDFNRFSKQFLNRNTLVFRLPAHDGAPPVLIQFLHDLDRGQ